MAAKVVPRGTESPLADAGGDDADDADLESLDKFRRATLVAFADAKSDPFFPAETFDDKFRRTALVTFAVAALRCRM